MRRLIFLLMWLALLPGVQAQAVAPMLLQEGMGMVDLWPHLLLHSDPSREQTVQDMLANPQSFALPPAAQGALGVRSDAVWLRATLRAAASHRWAVNIDFPVLHEVDFYLAQNGAVVQHAALGNQRPRADPHLRGRTPSMNLELTAGQDYELLIRVQTGGGMIVPVMVGDASALLPFGLREQMLQGILIGLALCLLVYSLAQWASLREQLFAYYALLVIGSTGFSAQFFGIGSQFLWGDNLWMELHVASGCAFLAVMASFLFMGHTLASHLPRSRFLTIMHCGAALSAMLGAAFLLDLIRTHAAMTILSLLGPLPSLISVPIALRRTRQGDALSTTLLVAWVAYLAAAVTLAILVQGLLPVTFWTLHSFQIGATIDMLLFVRMLSLRTRALRAAAIDAARERDAMHSLAHSDPLTGLPNRRGLDIALAAALPRAGNDRLLALYILDLDGFKPVNDQHGHGVGDELLVAVTHRLREHLRHNDTVARIGGDEFVVMTSDLRSAEQAHELGSKLLESFHAPFFVGPKKLHVGLTIGYVLAPHDGSNAADLIQQADAAMYSGKQAGKFCLRRSTDGLSPSTA